MNLCRAEKHNNVFKISVLGECGGGKCLVLVRNTKARLKEFVI